MGVLYRKSNFISYKPPMSSEQLAAIKAQIKIEETAYPIELKSTQKFENLKAIRLRINAVLFIDNLS